MKATDKDSQLSILGVDERINVKDYEKILDEDHLTIDVRSVNEFEICQLPKSVNIPIKELLSGKRDREVTEMAKEKSDRVFLVCRRGNDSQLAVEHLMKVFKDQGLPAPKDIIGGLHSWTKNVDPNFPIY
jgi:adenylyltransferase/sulfurtransferase